MASSPLESSDSPSHYRRWHFALIYWLYVEEISSRIGSFSITGEIMSQLGFTESQMALILSYFFIPFVFSSVLFGFLGDRYSRKRLLQIGTLIEAASQLICGASNSFTTFAGGRILLGVFQAAGSCITPTVLADMYLNESKRTMMSGIFSTAMPIGVAVAFISAPVITSYFGFRTVYYLSAVRHLAIAQWAQIAKKSQNQKRPFSIPLSGSKIGQKGDLFEKVVFYNRLGVTSAG